MTTKTKSKNIQIAITISASSVPHVLKIAKEEKRSRSGTVNLLIEEALQARKIKK